jgi:hypothetical protein
VAEAFSIIAIVATVVQSVALVALHLLPTGYNPVRDAVSHYGVGRYRRWYWLQVVAGGVGALAVAIALSRLQPFTPTAPVAALVVAAVARFLIPFFPTDQYGSRFQTLHGTVHMLLAVLAFGGLIWAATDLWSTLQNYTAWQSAHGALTILPWFMAGSIALTVLGLRGPRLKPFFGVWERLFYVSSIAWIFVVSIDLAAISG